MNNLDPAVAERPDELIVYGGSGRAARSWEAFDAIVDTLRRLEHDETLVVQSGKPVAVFRTHPWSPRVIAVEVLCACQAIDLLAPLKTSAGLQSVHGFVRSLVPTLTTDRPPSPDIEAIAGAILAGPFERSCSAEVK